jgi:hypothetical protein
VVLSAFAKPSWLICFLPGLALTLVFDSRLQSRRETWEAAAVILIGGLAVLGWQYAFLYGDKGADRIVFTPQKWLAQYGSLAPLKLILSIAYPLSVLVLFWNELRQSLMLRLAWSTFIVSLPIAYGFSETGTRAGHDNLGWSAQIALFVLFVASAIAMAGELRQAAASPSGFKHFRAAVPVSLFILHLAGGVIWYATYFTEQGNWDWY